MTMIDEANYFCLTDLLYLLFVFDFFIVFILCVVSVSVFLVLFVFDETSSQTWGGVGRSSSIFEPFCPTDILPYKRAILLALLLLLVLVKASLAIAGSLCELLGCGLFSLGCANR